MLPLLVGAPTLWALVCALTAAQANAAARVWPASPAIPAAMLLLTCLVAVAVAVGCAFKMMRDRSKPRVRTPTGQQTTAHQTTAHQKQLVSLGCQLALATGELEPFRALLADFNCTSPAALRGLLQEGQKQAMMARLYQHMWRSASSSACVLAADLNTTQGLFGQTLTELFGTHDVLYMQEDALASLQDTQQATASQLAAWQAECSQLKSQSELRKSWLEDEQENFSAASGARSSSGSSSCSSCLSRPAGAVPASKLVAGLGVVVQHQHQQLQQQGHELQESKKDVTVLKLRERIHLFRLAICGDAGRKLSEFTECEIGYRQLRRCLSLPPGMNLFEMYFSQNYKYVANKVDWLCEEVERIRPGYTDNTSQGSFRSMLICSSSSRPAGDVPLGKLVEGLGVALQHHQLLLSDAAAARDKAEGLLSATGAELQQAREELEESRGKVARWKQWSGEQFDKWELHSKFQELDLANYKMAGSLTDSWINDNKAHFPQLRAGDNMFGRFLVEQQYKSAPEWEQLRAEHAQLYGPDSDEHAALISGERARREEYAALNEPSGKQLAEVSSGEQDAQLSSQQLADGSSQQLAALSSQQLADVNGPCSNEQVALSSKQHAEVNRRCSDEELQLFAYTATAPAPALAARIQQLTSLNQRPMWVC